MKSVLIETYKHKAFVDTRLKHWYENIVLLQENIALIQDVDAKVRE